MKIKLYKGIKGVVTRHYARSLLKDIGNEKKVEIDFNNIEFVSRSAMEEILHILKGKEYKLINMTDDIEKWSKVIKV